MVRHLILFGLLILATSNLRAEEKSQNLDSSKAWYQPELNENNDSACEDLLNDARNKFFGNANLEEAYRNDNTGNSNYGKILNWTTAGDESTTELDAFGKVYQLDYNRNPGCGGACETIQPTVVDHPNSTGHSYYDETSRETDEPPAASDRFLIAKTPQNIPYLFILGTSAEYANELLVYKLKFEGKWKAACRIVFEPNDFQRLQTPAFTEALKSIQNLRNTVRPLAGGSGDCGSTHTAWRWGDIISSKLEQARASSLSPLESCNRQKLFLSK